MTRYSNNEPVDVDVYVHAETAKAILVSHDANRIKGVWLPISQIEVDTSENPKIGDVCNITMPQWLAEEKELV